MIACRVHWRSNTPHISPAVAAVPQVLVLKDVKQVVPPFPIKRPVRIERKCRIRRNEMEVWSVWILCPNPRHLLRAITLLTSEHACKPR
jgi:hypothetical protein